MALPHLPVGGFEMPAEARRIEKWQLLARDTQSSAQSRQPPPVSGKVDGELLVFRKGAGRELL